MKVNWDKMKVTVIWDDEKVKASKSNFERVKTVARNASSISQHPVHQFYIVSFTSIASNALY